MTDLFSAYSQPEQLNVNEFDFDQRVKNVEYSPNIEKAKDNVQNQQEHIEQPQEKHSRAGVYDQGEFLQNINEENIKQQMIILKKELDAEKKKKQIEYKENYERSSIIDNFFKKKKEMLRFISLSLIIVFALSLHEVISFYLRDFIDNTNLTENKETLTRFGYPLMIFFIAWMMKTLKQ